MNVAVYGTLRTDVGKKSIRGDTMEWYGELVGPCKIRGDLYEVGYSFPALVPGNGIVIGQLWKIDEWAIDECLRTLDFIESYKENNPVDSMYLRREVRLIEPEATASVYLWNYSTEQLQKIESGDWKERCESSCSGRTGR